MRRSTYGFCHGDRGAVEWVAWYNHRRLLEPPGSVPPAEFEEAYYARQAT